MVSVASNISIFRALTTINAPRALHIDAETLASCLRLECRDPKWRPHLQSFYDEVDAGIILDIVREGTVTFRILELGVEYWDAEESENARWIREMASVAMA